MKTEFGYFLASEETAPNHDLEVTDKYTGDVVARVAVADQQAIDYGIAAAVAATEPMRRLAPYERRDILKYCVQRFEEMSEHLAQVLCIEAGKPIKDSRGEVARLIETFQVAAEEATRINGEVLNLELSSRTQGYRGMEQRVPVGPCSFISPFNFPLNLAAHKIAPAIACGCPFILKPASFTPLSALLIGDVLADSNLPKGAFSILPCHRSAADLFTTDPRLKLLSFTGSPEVGWALKSKAGRKKVTLELGGNAACIVDEDANLDDAVERMLIGAFYQSGQSCISVQRILVHANVYDLFREKLLERTRALKVGDPKLESTFIGPLIAESESIRLMKWIEEAAAAGAKILCGGQRDGALLQPTLIENCPKELRINSQEAFGPVAILSRFENFDEALREVNNSDYGLQAGIFTRDIYKMLNAWDQLEVGGIVIGDVPSWRVDNMPYGGVKASGLGREGVRYAIEDMTERRLLVIR